MLQALLNRCYLIVNLFLEYCYGLEKIELLNLQRIKSVTIKTFRNQRVQIDAQTLELVLFRCWGSVTYVGYCQYAPNFVALEYIGDQIPKAFVDANLQWNCHPKKVILFCNL